VILVDEGVLLVRLVLVISVRRFASFFYIRQSERRLSDLLILGSSERPLIGSFDIRQFREASYRFF
jgi:hypothetical protein